MTNPYIPKPSLGQLYPIHSHWDFSKLNINSLVYPTPADDFQECDEEFNSIKLKTFSEEDLFFFIMNHKNVHPICIGMRIEGEKQEDNRTLFFNWDDYPYMRGRFDTDKHQRELLKEHKELIIAIELDCRINQKIKDEFKILGLKEEEKLLNKFN